MFDLIPMSGREKNIWNFFDNWEKNMFQNAFPAGSMQLRTDITDEGDHYRLSAELPGFNRENIQVDIDRGILTISAQHNEEIEDKQDNFIRRERRFGTYSRSFDVSEVHTDAIAAKYENGVLTLNLPKKETSPLPPARQIQIQ
ncbi:Hsp20/alpha crystallin family protein [Oscillospiraceae bacterium MB08-C2-2]|nr:Hsp20/alpha crystallin family protein [Oscillospiraceae bacterium MB08-C2-2]